MNPHYVITTRLRQTISDIQDCLYRIKDQQARMEVAVNPDQTNWRELFDAAALAQKDMIKIRGLLMEGTGLRYALSAMTGQVTRE